MSNSFLSSLQNIGLGIRLSALFRIIKEQRKIFIEIFFWVFHVLIMCWRTSVCQQSLIHHQCQTFSKFDALLHKTLHNAACTTVPRFDKFRPIISLSKITQMWRDHAFAKATRQQKHKPGRVGLNLEKGEWCLC